MNNKLFTHVGKTDEPTEYQTVAAYRREIDFLEERNDLLDSEIERMMVERADMERTIVHMHLTIKELRQQLALRSFETVAAKRYTEAKED